MSILHAAAARNDQAKVMKLLAHGYDVNRRLKGTGATPLIHAAADRRTNADMLRVLVEHGADPHLTTEDNNQTALHKAAQRGQVDKVAYLLSLGMDVNQRDANGYAPILFAAYSKSDEKRELLQSLLTSGADAYRPTMYNETTVSACAGDFDLLRLFERERVMDILHWTPLMAATAWGTVDSMNALLKQKHDFRLRDKSCRTLWHLAIETGDVSKTELLYGQSDMPMDEDIGAFPNVFYAVMHDHSEMLNWLIEVGTDIQAQHALGSALEICAQMGASACLRILLDNQVFDHDVMNRAVSCAGNVESIKLLLDAGANIDHVTRKVTPRSRRPLNPMIWNERSFCWITRPILICRISVKHRSLSPCPTTTLIWCACSFRKGRTSTCKPGRIYGLRYNMSAQKRWCKCCWMQGQLPLFLMLAAQPLERIYGMSGSSPCLSIIENNLPTRL